MTLPPALEPVSHLIELNKPLSNYTYMKVGGIADYLAKAHTLQELTDLIAAAKTAKIRYLLLGGGSNTIFSDVGFRGLIILNQTNSMKINDHIYLTCDSGCPTNSVVNFSTKAGLSGMENFLGIPGSIGGAIYNNSHYLNQLIGDMLDQALILKEDGRKVWVDKDYFEFKYDYSVLHQTKEIVLESRFKLKLSDQESTAKLAKEALLRRKHSQPLQFPSSGCIFQNFKEEAALYPLIPPGITSAGALIDHAGLKGLSVGGARVSDIHANFIINTREAKAKDILDLSDNIIDVIRDRYGITLKREVFMLDEYGERMNT